MSKEIEAIYKEYVKDESLKLGTPYERLTALVYKILDDTQNVKHDVRARGEGKRTLHQIDVVIEDGNKDLHVIVECKDYDTKIGLKILKEFNSVVSQIRPDKALVVSKVGFTRPAITFADEEGIDLVVLRDFATKDLPGYIDEVNITIRAITSSNSQVGLNIFDIDNDNNLLKDFKSSNLMTKDFNLYDENFKMLCPLEQVIDINRDQLMLSGQLGGTKTINFEEKTYINFGKEFICIRGFNLNVEVEYNERTVQVKDETRVYSLVMEQLSEDKKLFIYKEDLKCWYFNSQGYVIEKP